MNILKINKNLRSFSLIIIILYFISSCHKGFDINQPNPDPEPPLIDSLCEDGERLPQTQVYYPNGDTIDGSITAMKNNIPRKFKASCFCGLNYFNGKPYLFISGGTSQDPYPLVYIYELFTVAIVPAHVGKFELDYDYLKGIKTQNKYSNNYFTLQHDVLESEYIVDTNYQCQRLTIDSLDLVNNYATGNFDIQYSIYKIHDKEYKNPPEIIRLAKGKFWCKLNK